MREASGETWVMEINTVPGSLAFYLWEPSGVSFPDLLDATIDIALHAHEQKSELLFSFESDVLLRAGGVKS